MNLYTILIQVLKIVLIFLFLSTSAKADWVTGPILAPGGTTLLPGHYSISTNNFYTNFPDKYNNLESVTALIFGINKFLDFQVSLPYEYNWHNHQKGQGI